MNSVIIRSFTVLNGSKVHLVHEGKTDHDSPAANVVMSMCGKTFMNPQMMSRPSTCSECCKRDNPLDLSPAQIVRLTAADEGRATSGNDMDLIRRDLVHPGTMLLTVRGRLLIEDLEHTTPWPDEDGLIHARGSSSRARARCGADLLGTRDASFSRLNKLLNLGDSNKVSCINCLADGQ